MYDYKFKLINKSDENDDIMKSPHSYLYKHIYCDSPSVYFSIINAKSIDKISKTYRQ